MNTEYYISDNIECVVNYSNPATYKLYLSTDLVNSIYEGKVYPYPNTSYSIINLNEVIENYVSYDDINFDDNWSYINVTYKIINSMRKSFRLVVTTSTTTNYDFTVENSWRKIGETLNGGQYSMNYQNMFKKYEGGGDAYIGHPIYLIYKASPKGNSSTDRYLRYQFVENGVDGASGNLTIRCNPNSLVLIRFTIEDYLITGNEDTVKFGYLESESQSYAYQYNIINCRPKYVLYFINRLGGINYVHGNDSSKMNTSLEVVDVNTNYRRFSTNQMVGNQSSFGVDRTVVTSTDTYVIQTPILSDSQHKYIEDLYTSPKCWVYDQYKYYSVLPTSQKYEAKLFKTDKLVNREIEVKKTINNKRR